MKMAYVVIIEKATDGSFSAFVPDLPGCVACGDSLDDLRESIRAAIQLHVESLQSHGEAVPAATTQTCTVMV
jgi:predicted RNase H-like HicB family nuclease